MWCVNTGNNTNEPHQANRFRIGPAAAGREAVPILRLDAAVGLGMAFLLLLFGSIVVNGYKAFTQTYIELPIYFDPAVIDPSGEYDHQTLFSADYWKLVKTAVYQKFPQVGGRKERRELTRMVSEGSVYELREQVLENPRLIGTTQHVLAGGR